MICINSLREAGLEDPLVVLGIGTYLRVRSQAMQGLSLIALLVIQCFCLLPALQISSTDGHKKQNQGCYTHKWFLSSHTQNE